MYCCCSPEADFASCTYAWCMSMLCNGRYRDGLSAPVLTGTAATEADLASKAGARAASSGVTAGSGPVRGGADWDFGLGGGAEPAATFRKPTLRGQEFPFTMLLEFPAKASACACCLTFCLRYSSFLSTTQAMHAGARGPIAVSARSLRPYRQVQAGTDALRCIKRRARGRLTPAQRCCCSEEQTSESALALYLLLRVMLGLLHLARAQHCISDHRSQSTWTLGVAGPSHWKPWSPFAIRYL